jgi:hypothetical protein
MRSCGVFVLEVLEPAQRELLAAVEYYELQVPGLGRRFRALVERGLRTIEGMPGVCPPLLIKGAPPDTRHVQLRPFLESIVFVERPHPLVVAVVHARRRPGYWVGRVNPGGTARE